MTRMSVVMSAMNLSNTHPTMSDSLVAIFTMLIDVDSIRICIIQDQQSKCSNVAGAVLKHECVMLSKIDSFYLHKPIRRYLIQFLS